MTAAAAPRFSRVDSQLERVYAVTLAGETLGTVRRLTNGRWFALRGHGPAAGLVHHHADTRADAAAELVRCHVGPGQPALTAPNRAARYRWAHVWNVTTPGSRLYLQAGGRGAFAPEFGYIDQAAAIAAIPASFEIFTWAGERVNVHWCIGLGPVTGGPE